MKFKRRLFLLGLVMTMLLCLSIVVYADSINSVVGSVRSSSANIYITGYVNYDAGWWNDEIYYMGSFHGSDKNLIPKKDSNVYIKPMDETEVLKTHYLHSGNATVSMNSLDIDGNYAALKMKCYDNEKTITDKNGN